jgi:uncharacterized NAD-dependent epimerase/dehydratase family protein
MCHDPVRKHMRGLPHFGLPGIAECLEANLQVARLTNPKVRAVGIALNTSAMAEDKARAICAQTADELGLPCSDPFRFGADAILDTLLGEPARTGARQVA